MTGQLTNIFDSALFPTLSSIQDDEERIRHSFQSALYYLNIVGLMITMVFMFNSELIIRIFLGIEWMNVNKLFIILSLSGVCMIHGSLGDIFLRSLALTKQQFFLRILQAAVSILFILLAARFGVLAVAVAYLASYSMIVLIKMSFIAKKIKYGLKNAIADVLIASRMLWFYIPVYLLCMTFIPNIVWGNCCKLSIFVITTVIVFFVCPNCVGAKYKQEMHSKVMQLIINKITLLKKVL